MSFCIVSGCTNRKKNKNYKQLEKENKTNKTIAFHIFPKDIEKKKKWLKALNLENYSPPKTGAVCSEHFKEYDYNLEYSLRKLKGGAVPCLIKEEVTNSESININVDHTISMIQHNDIEKITLIDENIHNDKTVYMDTTENNEMKIEEHHEPHSTLVEKNIYDDEIVDISTNENNDVKIEVHHEYHFPSVEKHIYNGKIMDSSTNENNNMKIGIYYQHCSTSISPDRILNFQTKNQLKETHRNELNRLKKQLYTSCYKLKKAQAKISLKHPANSNGYNVAMDLSCHVSKLAHEVYLGP